MAERPYIDYEKCQSVAACMDVCPVGVFEKEGDKIIVKNPDQCIQCKACEVSCPHGAVVVK